MGAGGSCVWFWRDVGMMLIGIVVVSLSGIFAPHEATISSFAGRSTFPEAGEILASHVVGILGAVTAIIGCLTALVSGATSLLKAVRKFRRAWRG